MDHEGRQDGMAGDLKESWEIPCRNGQNTAEDSQDQANA